MCLVCVYVDCYICPTVRLSLRHRPVLRDRLFAAVLAGAFAHGFYLVYPFFFLYILWIDPLTFDVLMYNAYECLGVSMISFISSMIDSKY